MISSALAYSGFFWMKGSTLVATSAYAYTSISNQEYMYVSDYTHLLEFGLSWVDHRDVTLVK